MNRPVTSTEAVLRANPKLRTLWEKDRQIRLNQPSRTSAEAMKQALEMKRVAGLRDSNLKSNASSNGRNSTSALADTTT